MPRGVTEAFFFCVGLKAYSGILLLKLAGYTLVYLLGAVLASVGC